MEEPHLSESDAEVRRQAAEYLAGVVEDEESSIGLAAFRAAAIVAGLPKRLGTQALRAITGKSGSTVVDTEFQGLHLESEPEEREPTAPKWLRNADDKYLPDAGLRFKAGNVIKLAQSIQDSDKIPDAIKKRKRVVAIISIGSIIGGVIEYKRRNSGD